MHSTNTAFERHFRLELGDVRGIYERTKKITKGIVVAVITESMK
jgi:hypothetical protein